MIFLLFVTMSTLMNTLYSHINLLIKGKYLNSEANIKVRSVMVK